MRIWNKNFTTEELNYFRNQKTVEVIKPEEKKAPGRGHIRDLSLLVNTGGFYRPDNTDQI